MPASPNIITRDNFTNLQVEAPPDRIYANLYEFGDPTKTSTIQKAWDTADKEGYGIVVALPSGVIDIDQELTLRNGCGAIGIMPRMTFLYGCADLGWTHSGGTIFRGTGTETLFKYQNTAKAQGSISEACDSVNGVLLQGFAIEDCKRAFHIGERNNYGIAFSRFQDISLLNIGITAGNIVDYAMEIANFHHLRIDNITAFKCLGLIHGYAHMPRSTCQPGNSMWSKLNILNWRDVANSLYPESGVKLGAYTTTNTEGSSLNYVVVEEIQSNCYTLVRTERAGSASIKCQGEYNASATLKSVVNACQLLATDTEGGWESLISMKMTTNCFIRIKGTSSGVSANEASPVVTQGLLVSDTYQLRVDCPVYDVSYRDSLDNASGSSTFWTGFLRSALRQNISTGTASQPYGVYMVLKDKTGTSYASPQLQITGNVSDSYRLYYDENNIVRTNLVPIVGPAPASQTSNRTWNRWEAGTKILSGAVTTQTLPAVNAAADGISFTFQANDANAHTIATSSSQTINGASTYALASGASVTVTAVNTGTPRWVITAKG